MRKLKRLTLKKSTLTELKDRTAKVAGKVTEPEKRKEVNRLWNLKKNKSFDDIRKQLKTMVPDGRCMYCEVNEGTDIEHFYPKSAFPLKAFLWENYLYACGNCNSNYKRTRFPLDAEGLPLLIDPTAEDPHEHIRLTPTCGTFMAKTRKGDNSIEVYGLNRETLKDGRKSTLAALQELIINYGKYRESGELERARKMRVYICTYPFVDVFLCLLEIAGSESASYFLYPECLETLGKYPEISEWCNS
ncbi:MAG: hypothetical protein GY765_20430 [bacterium]|nr:hypothetical protein [bacterium]